MSATVPVVIIGAGPTGLTAATLLGQYGVECLVLDRWESIYPQPRAVHLDDEIYRILARIGLREEFAAISRPLEGLRLVDRNMRMLGEFRRGTAEGKHGYPEAWRASRERIRVGGLFICDNTLWSGRVTGEVDDEGQRRRPQWTEAIKEMNDAAFADPEYLSTILPIRDGVLVALRLG